MKKYKVLFCDMDGTLIETVSGETFPKGIWDMKFKFDVLDAIKNLNPKAIFIVTNQGGIEKGLFPESFIYVKCQYVNDSIIDYCGIDTCFKYCGSNDRSNPMRKPNTGMLEGLFNKYKSWGYACNKNDCLMIGDASGLEGQFSEPRIIIQTFTLSLLQLNPLPKSGFVKPRTCISLYIIVLPATHTIYLKRIWERYFIVSPKVRMMEVIGTPTRKH